VLEYIRLPESFVGKGDFFALIVKGHSIVDIGVHEGEYVLVRKQRTAKRIGKHIIVLEMVFSNGSKHKKVGVISVAATEITLLAFMIICSDDSIDQSMLCRSLDVLLDLATEHGSHILQRLIIDQPVQFAALERVGFRPPCSQQRSPCHR